VRRADMKKTMPVGKLASSKVSYIRLGKETTCIVTCPNCLHLLSRRLSDPQTHLWLVDVPGTEIQCRYCNVLWSVERVVVKMRRVK